MAGAERIFNLLDTKPDVHDLPEAKPLPRIEGRVTFEHVTFGYNPDRPGAARRQLRSQARADVRAGRRDRQRQEQHRLADRALLSAADKAACSSMATTFATSPARACTSRWAWCCR